MTMSPDTRKIVFSVRLAVSVGWIGAIILYLTLGVATVTGLDSHTIRAAWTTMDLAGSYAIVPLALSTLLTGVLTSVGTKWGFSDTIGS